MKEVVSDKVVKVIDEEKVKEVSTKWKQLSKNKPLLDLMGP